ncbi:hypothetical protein OAI26_09025, partial [Sulfitobacter sp.]|nr:hypothetical protein [Sulfitobacter sp.]
SISTNALNRKRMIAQGYFIVLRKALPFMNVELQSSCKQQVTRDTPKAALSSQKISARDTKGVKNAPL